MLSNAAFVYTGLNGGTVQYDGLVAQFGADYATGTTDGMVMQFKILTVPEPGSASLILLGSLCLLRRRRVSRKTQV